MTNEGGEMTNDQRSPMNNTNNQTSPCRFDIRASSFVRHSSFVIRNACFVIHNPLISAFPIPRGCVNTFVMSLNVEILSRAADEARGLAMDAVQASKSGHLGLPLGCAEMGAVLYGYALKHNPDKPRWIGRDYFILSAGHGSMFLYAWLHLSGYDLSMDEIKRFRQLH